MRRLLGLLVVTALMTGSLPSTALATHSNGQGPAKDFVTGTLKLANLPTPLGAFPGQIHNNGSSDSPSGEAPADGHFYMDIFGTPTGTVSIAGDILCLTAIDNQAWLRAVVVDSNTDVAPPGFGVLAKVVDNHQGANELPDQASAYLAPPPGPNPSCPTMPFEVENSTAGNTTVHDGV
jgi:hypothetical protein